MRKNGKPWTEDTPGASVKNEKLRATERLGRALWKKWSGYHRRRVAETRMRCFKLLVKRVNARLFNSQVAALRKRLFNRVYRCRLKESKMVSTYNKVDTYDGEQESIVANTASEVRTNGRFDAKS